MKDLSQTDSSGTVSKKAKETSVSSPLNMVGYLQRAVQEGKIHSDESNKPIWTILENQLELVRNGLSDPIVVLSQFNGLLDAADKIAQLTGDNYRVQHDLLCDSIVRCALLSRLQILVIKKKSDEQLEAAVEKSFLALVDTAVKAGSEFGSKALKAATEVDELAKDPRLKIKFKAGSEVLEDVSKTVSWDECRRQIRDAIGQMVKSGFRLSALEASKNNFFHSLDSLIGKLARCSAQLGKDRRISEMIRDYSDWMDRHKRFRFLLSETHRKSERERIATLYDPEPDPDNPLLPPESKQLCRTLQGKLAGLGNDPLALVCGIGVDLVKGRIPKATDIAEQVKTLCKAISLSGESEGTPIRAVQRKTLGRLSRMLLEQQAPRRRSTGIQLEVTEIGLNILNDCVPLMEHGSDGAIWPEIKILAQKIRPHDISDQQRFLHQEEATDSYPLFRMDDETASVFEEMIKELGNIASQIGVEQETGVMISSYTNLLSERKTHALQEQFSANWSAAKEHFWKRYPDHRAEVWNLPMVGLSAAVALAVCGGVYCSIDASSLSSWVVWPARSIGCICVGVSAVLAIMLLLRLFHLLRLLFGYLAIRKRIHTAFLHDRKWRSRCFAVARQFNPKLTGEN